MTENTATRFDINNLGTPAARAHAEAEPALKAAIAEVEQQARAAGQAMTVAELSQHVSAKGGKPGLVEAYVKQVVKASSESKELKRLAIELNRDLSLAYELNRMMDGAAKAEEAMDRLHEERPSDRMRKLRDHLITLYVGEYATDVLRAVLDGDAGLREAATEAFVQAVRVTLRFADDALRGVNSGMTSEEESAAANTFRQSIGIYYLPSATVQATRLA